MAHEARNKDIGVNVVSSNEYHDNENDREQHTRNNFIEEGDFVTRAEEQDLSRGLHQRHISLIAIAGAIVSLLPCIMSRQSWASKLALLL